ncbi:MAG: hypothetical protein VX224_00530 [Candidatus Thermoplasmatota archaeon]|nr:hypothetical protein [Candidatus Thermoplasmatota archaeon]MEE3200541.1 hypothetical protein [Candidatus Thermoplasmatota archaeon]
MTYVPITLGDIMDNEKLMIWLTIIPLIVMGIAFMIGFIFDLGT